MESSLKVIINRIWKFHFSTFLLYECRQIDSEKKPKQAFVTDKPSTCLGEKKKKKAVIVL